MDILLYISANIEIFLKGLFLVQEMDDIAEIKLRAKRRIGEFSRELLKNEGNVNQYTKSAVPHDGEGQSKTSILAEAGIMHPERYEAIASLPDDVFERIYRML